MLASFDFGSTAFGRGERLTGDRTFVDVSPVRGVTSSRAGSSRLFTLWARSSVLVCVVASAPWIALSDRVTAQLCRHAGVLTLVSTLKGWGFVAVTGGLSP